MVISIDFLAVDIISLIFERGAFDSVDTLFTATYLKKISIPFVLIFISTIFFQPFFAIRQKLVAKISHILALIFLVSLAVCIFYLVYNNISSKQSSLILLYTLSITSFFISIYAYLISYKYEIN